MNLQVDGDITAHEVDLDIQGVVEGHEGGRGEANRVEPDVAGEGAVEGVVARSEREGLRPLDELDVEGSGRLAVLGGGESGGRAEEEGPGAAAAAAFPEDDFVVLAAVQSYGLLGFIRFLD
jgi:hypothetical protein